MAVVHGCGARVLVTLLAGILWGAVEARASEGRVKLLQLLPNTLPALPSDRQPAPPDPQPYGNPGDRVATVSIGTGVTLPNPPSYYAINMIEVDEEGGENNPCLLRLWGNMLDPQYAKDGKRRLLALYELPTCGSIIQSVDLEKAGFAPSQHRFLRGLRVCRQTHRGEWELKGVGIVAGEVSSGSVTVKPRGPEGHGFKRANCPDHLAEDFVGTASAKAVSGWTAWAECPHPDRELMTGVALYIHGKYISGMIPVCQQVTASVVQAPVKDGQGY